MKKHIVSILPVLSGKLEEVEGACDIRFNKISWAENGTVNVRLCSEVDNSIDVVRGEYFFHPFVVAQVNQFKMVSAAVVATVYVGKIFQVAGIGQFVCVNNGAFKIGVLEQMAYEVRADETGTSRD